MEEGEVEEEEMAEDDEEVVFEVGGQSRILNPTPAHARLC